MTILIYIVAGVVAVGVLFLAGFRKVAQGKAYKRGSGVFFQYYWQIPGTGSADGIDLTLKKVGVECRSERALECADGVKLELRLVALIRVKPNAEAVKQVVQNYGAGPEAEARMQKQLEAALEKAVRDAGKQITSLTLVEHEQAFKQQVTQKLGLEKTGFQMDSLALEFVDPDLLNKTRLS